MMAAKSSKAKKQQRKEASKHLQELKKLVTAAEEDPDVLRHFVPFQRFSRNGISASIACHTAQGMPLELQDWVYQLCKQNMHNYYLPVWGWNERKKRKELKEEPGRFLLASDSEPPHQPLAYVNFRFELEEDVPIVYCYELQLEETVQRKGLGKFLMQLLELVGIKYGMQEVMLTVMSANPAALGFYTKLGYKVHATSPGFEDPSDDTGYRIIHKCLPRPAASKPCLKDNTTIHHID